MTEAEHVAELKQWLADTFGVDVEAMLEEMGDGDVNNCRQILPAHPIAADEAPGLVDALDTALRNGAL